MGNGNPSLFMTLIFSCRSLPRFLKSGRIFPVPMMNFGASALQGMDSHQEMIDIRHGDVLDISTVFRKPPLLNGSDFLNWIRLKNERKLNHDREYSCLVRARELRKLTSVREAELALDTARLNMEGNPKYLELQILEKRIQGATQAITNMMKFLESGYGDHEKKESVTNHLVLKRDEFERNQAAEAQLRDEIPERDEYLKCKRVLEELYVTTGLQEALQTGLSEQKYGGKGRNSRGRSFEDIAMSALRSHLIPRLAQQHMVAEADIFIVRNAKLGIPGVKGSSAELDYVICIASARPPTMLENKPAGKFCTVLALVEAKRNPDDIGEAFVSYQRALGWLSGCEDEYDPKEWRTKGYPRGHFDRPFVHFDEPSHQHLVFARESFVGLRRRRVQVDGFVGEALKQRSSISCLGDDHDDGDGEASASSPSSPPTQDIEGIEGSEPVAAAAPIEVDDGSTTQGVRDLGLVTDLLPEGEDEGRGPSASGGISTHELFPRTVNLFVDDLYFVCRFDFMESVPSKASCWLLNKVATERAFDLSLGPECEDALETLRNRALQRHPHIMSTLSLLEMHKDMGLHGQLMVLHAKSC